MKRPFFWMAIALAAAPAFAWLVYRLAKGLGFLEPPANRQHELRRTIVVAIYAILLFLPVLIYGFEKGWPRAWVIFGAVDGLALLFFAGSGMWSARQLWALRHDVIPSAPAALGADGDGDGEGEPGHADLAAAAPHGPEPEEPPSLIDPPVRS